MSETREQTVAREIGNLVYQAIITYTETLERSGAIFGNGHHLAQKVSNNAGEQVAARVITTPPVKPRDPDEHHSQGGRA